jgi:HSP20 family protein
MYPSIEQTIDRVEQLYATITGRQPPHANGGVAHIPPEIDPGRHVEEQLAKLLAAIEQRFAHEPAQAQTWQPRASAWQDEDGFELAIDMPGIARDSLAITCDGQTLYVRGHRPAPWREHALAPVSCEAPFGAFARTFALPIAVEPSAITARLDAGVLRVRVARRPPAEPASITVQA